MHNIYLHALLIYFEKFSKTKLHLIEGISSDKIFFFFLQNYIHICHYYFTANERGYFIIIKKNQHIV